MQEKIKAEIKESLEAKNLVLKQLVPQIEQAAKMMIAALKNGNKILFLGNGGSAADSQHLAAELVGRFRQERRALSAIALTTDTSILTAIGNDYSFDQIFARQIEGLANSGDVVVGLSTSGNSKNVIIALEKARELGCKSIGLLACDGGRIAGLVDLALTIPCKNTPRAQESHIMIGHILCSMVEQELFPA
ncbi:phosphoheptose isomerase [candidate division WOR-1 bacterium RIFOXYB2_FULL_48_7]|uniref:Phosphoheptose isomerase n=1 Tax=candidate division WOR-1 bacterium RIFOXYB2_FULL_48_7 TaxID=1802583 RepID=A0A1F4TVV6_UNCSA|nr:MAG: phosphoheptose isomerase [candidate division WOR-1 bacterium RIFOXYB2_FULL_48_7]